MSSVIKTRYYVEQSTNGVEIVASRGDYDEPRIVVDDAPRARITVPDPSGVIGNSVLVAGKEFKIYRGATGRPSELVFHGIVEEPELEEDEGGSHITVRGVHKGYKMLQQHLCDTYDYDEDGDPATVRDGVTVNPWSYFIFRKVDGPLDVRGEALPIDGVKFNDVVKCLIGTKFIHQVDFRDNSYLRASQVYATTNVVQVHRDGETSDVRPALQRVRNGTGFKAGGSIDTIPLMNGSHLIDAMGDISAVTVTLIGVVNGTDAPTVAVTRNARDATPTYSAAEAGVQTNVLYDDAVTDTGLDKWVFTFTSGDLPATANKNALGVRITIPGTAASTGTTKIHYMKVECTTASDTGLSEGTIGTYDNPISFRDDIDPSDWCETDLSEENRLKAMEMVRQLTESDSAVNPLPHWDIWIDSDLAVHFSERRGADIDFEYAFTNKNLRKVSHRFSGSELAYQTIAYGAGSGPAQTRIVSQEEYSAGGLYDSDRDPSDGALYGQLARVVKFVDTNEKSAVTLYRKARAFHKLKRDPIESIQIEIAPQYLRYFETGDGVTIKNVKTRTTGVQRVVELTRGWDEGDMERLKVRLGNPLDDLARAISNTKTKHETLVVRPTPQQRTTGLSGDGIHCTKDHYGVYSFAVPEGVERVLLKVSTVPWQITSRGAASGGGDSVTSEGGGSAALTSASGGGTVVSADGDDTGAGWTGAPRYLKASSTPVEAASLDFYRYGTLDGEDFYVGVSNGSTPPDDLEVGDLGNHTHSHAHSVTLPNHTHGVTIPSHTHVVDIDDHVHEPEFGIWQFDGDSGNGSGTPVYGMNIEFAVDPTVSAAGIPTTFSTEKTPHKFGKSGGPQSIEVDITGYLAVDSNGVIKTGEHRVYFLTSAGTSNTKGLASLMITPIVKTTSR